MPQGPMSSPLMRPLVVLALPGMYLFYKYNQYKRRQQESARRRLTERELQHLNHKIDKLLSKLEENEPELATTQEEECVICINAKATMQTAPCGHQVVCRKCFVKTIQMAVSQRLLPLRCVVCRAKILRLKQTGNNGGHHHVMSSTSSSSGASTTGSTGSGGNSSHHHRGGGGVGNGNTGGTSHHHHQNGGSSTSVSSGIPASASAYSVSTTHSSSTMPNSDSLYSVSSGTSSISGTSSLSSGSMGGGGITCGGGKSSLKCCSTGHCFGGAYPRQPTGALRRSQQHAMKIRLQEYWHGEAGAPGRLPPIRELPPCPPPGPQAASTRIRCAQKIVTQLESATPICDKKEKKSTTKSSSIIKSLTDLAPSTSKEVPYKQLTPQHSNSGSTAGSITIINSNGKKYNSKHEKNDNKKNELAEKKREEKAKQKAEKEAKREAKKEAKKEEELAKKEAKEEKKKAKKEAKAAAAAAAQAAAVVIVATSVDKKVN